MPNKRTTPLSVRLSPELDARLKQSAERLRMKKHTLAQEAIEAAVDAIETNGYRLVVPVKFELKLEVTHIATPNPVTYPPHKEERIVVEEKPEPTVSTKEEGPKTATEFVRKHGLGAGEKPSSEKTSDRKPQK